MTALADTGFVVALENSSDLWHTACLDVLRREREIYLPQSVLNEVCYLLTKTGGNRATARFLQRIPNSKFMTVPLVQADLDRTAELLIKYADSRVDYVDASVVAIAERLNVTRILTIDRRGFQIIRPPTSTTLKFYPSHPPRRKPPAPPPAAPGLRPCPGTPAGTCLKYDRTPRVSARTNTPPVRQSHPATADALLDQQPV